MKTAQERYDHAIASAYKRAERTTGYQRERLIAFAQRLWRQRGAVARERARWAELKGRSTLADCFEQYEADCLREQAATIITDDL